VWQQTADSQDIPHDCVSAQRLSISQNTTNLVSKFSVTDEARWQRYFELRCDIGTGVHWC